MTAYALSGPILADDAQVHDRAWVLGGRITYERPRHTPTETIDGWALPGLVDMHCHLAVGPSGPVSGEQIIAHAVMERDVGTLLIRDTGSTESLDALAGRDDLPLVIPSGRFIARPKRYLRGYAVEITDDARAGGGLAAEAARQAASGAWVKVIADWIDRDLGAQADLTPLFDAADLASAAHAAHAAGARITAHTFATESIDALLDAGFDCIEHGTGMTGAQMERAAREGIPVVPTLLQVANFPAFAAQAGDRFPRFSARMNGMYERRYQQVGAMHEAGMTVLLGTDAGTSIAHGDLAREAAELARCMSAAEVVAAATWRARHFLGASVLAEGDRADVVVVDADPRIHIDTLAHPVAVLLAGRRVR